MVVAARGHRLEAHRAGRSRLRDPQTLSIFVPGFIPATKMKSALWGITL